MEIPVKEILMDTLLYFCDLRGPLSPIYGPRLRTYGLVGTVGTDPLETPGKGTQKLAGKKSKTGK